MNTDLILSRLYGVRPNQNGWTAKCPAHEDKSASLSIAVKNERVLIHCFAGCSIHEVMGAIGLSLGELFPDREEPKPMHSRERSELWAMAVAHNRSLLFDIEVMRIGLETYIGKDTPPEDYETFKRSSLRILGILRKFKS